MARRNARSAPLRVVLALAAAALATSTAASAAASRDRHEWNVLIHIVTRVLTGHWVYGATVGRTGGPRNAEKNGLKSSSTRV